MESEIDIWKTDAILFCSVKYISYINHSYVIQNGNT